MKTSTIEVPLTRDEVDALVFAMRRLGPTPEATNACGALRMLQAAQSLDDLRSLQGEREDMPERRATDGLRRHASVADALAARQS